jgi:hypothetical protein
MYSNYLNAMQISSARAHDKVLRSHEARAAALLFNTATWTGASLTTALSTPWSTHSTATPLDDVKAAIVKVWEGTGLWPNCIILTKLAFLELRRCTQFLDAVAAGGAGSGILPGQITVGHIQQAFDLPKVLIAGSAKNSANEGQDATVASLWDKTMAMVCRCAETEDIQEPCVARCFHWGADGSQIGGVVDTFRDENIRSDVVRVRHQVDQKVLYAQAGHLLTSVL